MSNFFTIGHSTRPLAVFAELLLPAKVELVADVRAVPRSRTSPQYNQNTLPKALKSFHLNYRAGTCCVAICHRQNYHAPEESRLVTRSNTTNALRATRE